MRKRGGFFVCLVWRFSFSQRSTVKSGPATRAVAACLLEAGQSAGAEGKAGLVWFGFF